MFTIIIILTFIFCIKLGVDYVTAHVGTTLVSPINGFLIGFDTEEEILECQREDSEEIVKELEHTVEIYLGFVAVIFAWTVDYQPHSDEDEGSYQG